MKGEFERGIVLRTGTAYWYWYCVLVLVLRTRTAYSYSYCVRIMEISHGKEKEEEKNKWHACLGSFSRTAKLKREVEKGNFKGTNRRGIGKGI